MKHVFNQTSLRDMPDYEALTGLLVAALAPACIYKAEHRGLDPEGGKRFVNLIVLLSNSDTRPVAVHDPVLELLRLSGAPVHCSVHHAHTVTGWIAGGHPFFCRHVRAQHLVYSDGSPAVPEAGSQVMDLAREWSRAQFALYLGRAGEFYRCAGILAEGSPLRAFMLHQSVELGYRGILESLNGCCRKTHELRQLRAQCARCAPALGEVFPEDTAAEKRLVNLLEAAYSGSRYDSGFCLSTGDLELLQGRAGEFLATAERVFEAEMMR